MRILSNLLAFLLFIVGVVVIFLVLVPELEKNSSSTVTFIEDEEEVKEDVPLPTKLHPKVESAKEKLKQLAQEKGIDIVITDGIRSKKEQNELYAQGRSDKGDIVTHARGGESYHNYGLAIDYALKLDNGEVVWDIERDGNGNGKADWMEVAHIAKDLGFEWGGDWPSFKDYPHLQMDFGLSIRELRRGERPSEDTYPDESS
ncbi:M15 family metallopeptidase [Pontibacillus yanchengensis]|uniref:Peptidase n=1 Tax=Pontibacillus yanchengensis Y32 TaxID=1385514 RepID=A0A0A2TH67_9BACI|nr:M15 family metallopeptidase [Pontibacillus yanchengensis]KGP73416.1 peptidase [Pontibacillus yanchengensis Y32]